MNKFNKFKNIFSLGEISPNLYHRFDLPQYEAGLAKLKNGFARTEGTITNCPELDLLQNFNIQGSVGLKWFKYNVDDRVPKKCIMLLVTTNQFRFFDVSENNIFTLRKDFSASYSAEDVSKLSIIQIENYIMVCCLGKKPNMIKIDELDLTKSVVVDYWESIIDFPMKSLKTEFIATPTTWACASWHKNPNASDVTIKITPNVKIFSDAFLGRLKDGQISLFGNLFRITNTAISGNNVTFTMSAIEGEGLIPPTDKYDEATDKRVDVWETFDVKKISYMESIFSNNSYPALCSYYQGRLVFANIQNNPDFICFSMTGDYFKFSGSTKNQDSGFSLAVPSDDRTIIKKLISWNSLLVVSDNGIWSTPIMQSITPTNSFMSRQLIPSISSIQDNFTISNGAMYYVNSFNNKIFTLLYNYDSKMYTAEEISTFSNHLLKNGVHSISRMQYEGNDYIMCDVGDYFAMCTLDREQQVTSWNRYYSGGKYNIINIENDSLFISFENNNIRSFLPSYTRFKNDMEIELLPPILGAENRYLTEIPYIVKKGYTYSNVIISIIGEYDLDVNGDKKKIPFGTTDFSVPTNISFDVVQAMKFFNKTKPLNVKNNSDKKVEISAIYYFIESEEEEI
ncbi:MAG: hypothetical protein ACRC6E_10465 [Fusobacteriaceae bacterium]